jgi:hypothetical protein
MSSLNPKQTGLRNLGNDTTNLTTNTVFSHIESLDGKWRIELAEPMTARGIELAAMARNCLLLVLTEGTELTSYTTLFASARVQDSCVDELTHELQQSFVKPGRREQFNRPWVQTQNQKYWLVVKT